MVYAFGYAFAPAIHLLLADLFFEFSLRHLLLWGEYPLVASLPNDEFLLRYLNSWRRLDSIFGEIPGCRLWDFHVDCALLVSVSSNTFI